MDFIYFHAPFPYCDHQAKKDMMDSFQRSQQRHMPGDGRGNNIRPMPMPMPIPQAARPQSNQNNVVDLTQDDAQQQQPLPFPRNSQPHTTKPFSRPLVFNRSTGMSNPSQMPTNKALPNTPQTQGRQLPPKNKHAEPSKIRMIDTTTNQKSQNESNWDAFTESQPSSQTSSQPLSHANSQHHHSARQFMRDGAEVVKHAIKDGFARAQIALEQANHGHENHPRPLPHSNGGYRPNHSSQNSNAFIVNDDDDDEPLPSTFAGPTMTAEERDQQLQDMLSSMVLPPELGDIDLEKASNVKGLSCKLMPHQVAGYLWLKGREGGKHKGGILADDMGLGKTVQMLALIVGNSPQSEDTTINKIRLEPETTTKKSKKKVVPDSDDATVEEKSVEIKGKQTLIIAPLAVIRQWEREIKEKTSPPLKVLVHHGATRTKTTDAFKRYDVVITTYPTVASEWNNIAGLDKPKKKGQQKKNTVPDSSEEDESESDDQDSDDSFEVIDAKKKKSVKTAAKKLPPAPLFDFDWLRIVLDEAQNIKNHRTKASSACSALSKRALSKWCLSGTPIQNEALEMFSLIRFLGIPPFDEYAHFREKISDPLKSTNQNRVNWGMKRLCAVLTTIMLRRTKDTTHDGKPILNLPDRHVEVISTDFEDSKERDFYDDLENQVKRNLEEAEGAGTKVNHMVTLLMLLRLRQACSHPSLVNRNVRVDAGAANGPAIVAKTDAQGEGQKVDEDDDGLTELLAGLSVASKRCDRCQKEMTREEIPRGGEHCKVCHDRIQMEKLQGGGKSAWAGKSSTKIRTMLRLLNTVREEGDEKTIVFSQFTSFLDLVEPFLREEKHKFVRYDGSLKPEERERALDRIRSDPSVRLILISFKAGNVGLNLTCCSRVILMDLWWNPMLEAQSIDRAHRLGQQRNVHVYKLVINNSVEERILALQDKKRALAEAALEGSKLSKANKLDRKELMYLFSGGPVS